MKTDSYNLWLAAVTIALAWGGCDSGVRTPGTGDPQLDGRHIALVDGGSHGQRPDLAGVPRLDTLLPTPDHTPLPTPDTMPPDTQAQPAGPQPPFGANVGMTAANFTVPDCSNQNHSLHDYFNKSKAVIVMLNQGT